MIIKRITIKGLIKIVLSNNLAIGLSSSYNEKQGFIASCEISNGDIHEITMTADEIREHAFRISHLYRKGTGPWIDHFHAMALNYVLRKLIMTLFRDKIKECIIKTF